MPVAILLQIVSRTFLWIFLLSIDAAGPLLFFFDTEKHLAYELWLLLASLVLLSTWLFSTDALIQDIRELCIYDVVVQLAALLLFTLGVHTSTFRIAFSNTLFLLKYIRLAWPAKTADGRQLARWPVFGLYGWWQQRRLHGWRHAPSQRQCRLFFLTVSLCFLFSLLMAYCGMALKVAYFCLFAIAVGPLLYRLTRQEICQQYRAYRKMARAATRAAAAAAQASGRAQEKEHMNAMLAANNQALADAHAEIAALLATRQAQQQRLETYNAALRDAAHDLHQPMAVVRAWADTLLGSTPGTDAWREHGVKLQEAIRQMSDFIDSTIHGAQVVTGILQPCPQAVDLRALAHRFQSDWLNGPMSLQLDRFDLYLSPGAPFWVQADLLMLKRILRNLLVNAAQHAGPGRGILLSLRQRDGQCLIQVWDQGPGIAEGEGADGVANFLAFAARLRTLGGRSDSNGAPRGYRLGMNNVLQLCLAAGIRLHLHARAGRGSVFSFTLPLAPLGKGTPVLRPTTSTPADCVLQLQRLLAAREDIPFPRGLFEPSDNPALN